MDFYRDDLREEQLKRERKKRNKRKRLVRRIIMTVMTIIILSLGGCCAFLLVQYNQEKNRAAEAIVEIGTLEDRFNSGDYITTVEADKMVEEAVLNAQGELLNEVRSTMESGQTTLTLLEKLFPDLIITADKGRYHFFEVNPELARNDFSYEDLSYPVLNEETGDYIGDVTLAESAGMETRKGIDVSKFQGKINWKKVANDDIDFAYMRLGYRGYGSGKIVLDDTFEYNIEKAKAAGLDIGVYFFTEAVNEKEGIEEAEFVLENLEDYKVDLPIVIDVEESASSDSRTKDLTKEERTKAVIAFCERIKEAGHEVMIYGNTKSFMVMMDNEQLEDYDKWFAYYKYPLRFPYKMKMWQYTSSGEVDGIEGGTDINIMFY